MSWAYLEDASGFRGFADEVLVPANESELLEIVDRARRSKTPLTIAGAGSGITGGRCPEGGWLVSMEKFTKLEIQEGVAVCGAGVHLIDLHAAARQSGQFYPPDPTETLAAVGGTIACNASGSRSFRYGATRRWIERVRVVLLDGRVLDVRRGDRIDFDVPEILQPKACKHSAGYPLAPGMDWIDLFAGSEGTLGIVIEASLKLLPSAKSPSCRCGVLPERRRRPRCARCLASRAGSPDARIHRRQCARLDPHEVTPRSRQTPAVR